MSFNEYKSGLSENVTMEILESQKNEILTHCSLEDTVFQIQIQIQIQKSFIASYLHQQLTVTSHILYHKVHKSTQYQIVNIIQIW